MPADLKRNPAWPQSVVEQLARVLGETMTGSEIGNVLAQLQMSDPGADMTKWKRLHDAFAVQHNADGGARRLVTFITRAMDPVRYRIDPDRFTSHQDDLNEVLAFVGLRVNDKGEVARGTKVSTLSEAAQHANALRAEMRRRGVHSAVLDYCTLEILARNSFHASLEATKSVADRLRSLTGESSDGSPLVDAVLARGQRPRPRVVINRFATETEISEQKGFANLCRGMFSMFRNPVAHDPRLRRAVTDDELLDVLTVTSLIHRRLDDAVVT